MMHFLEKAGAWVVEFAYDTLIFLLALRKVFRARRALEIPLLSVLIRDGAAYFGAMSLANLATAPRPVQSEVSGSVEYMTGYISVTLISRMLVHLHQAADTTHAESMPMTMDTIRFHNARTGLVESSKGSTSTQVTLPVKMTGNES
ncbi:hypothetical protein Moror_14457 [Moniliophthora roreri MCA 2997]|uniref:Uncharacterized protein n=1 Tax=Moniliophthora roreri (strain MCA 2997) TaxID=1381753 RepID=V2WPQ8_MONRO|nr:hypothetical protein Moror_14457 [Moniliophthora roreri MCA 2997]